jgi:hypothetical protein
MAGGVTGAGAVLTVGVTGHRPNRLVLPPAAVKRRCLDALSAIAAGSRHCRKIAISALAEGADRAFAEAALTARFELHALLPFASHDYETTFSDPLGLPHYKALLRDTAGVEAMAGSLADAEEAYQALGQALAERADMLVAVWDGAPGQGRGGTPEVIETALAAGKPVIWIDAGGVAPRRLIVRDRREPGGRLAQLAHRARLIGRRRLRDLTARLVAGWP